MVFQRQRLRPCLIGTAKSLQADEVTVSRVEGCDDELTISTPLNMSTVTVSTRKRKPTSSKRLFATPRSGKRQRTNPMTRPRFATLIRQQVPIGRGPISPSAVVSLRYQEHYISDGFAGDKIWRLNSIFAPSANGLGTAHQPLGRDQYAAFYNRYRVLGARVKVMFILNKTVTDGAFVGILADNNDVVYSNILNGGEQQRSITKFISPDGPPVSLVRYFDCAKVTGVTKAAYKDDRFQAIFGQNPSENIMLHVLHSTPQNGGLLANELHIRVQLDYKVEMFDPLHLAPS